MKSLTLMLIISISFALFAKKGQKIKFSADTKTRVKVHTNSEIDDSVKGEEEIRDKNVVFFNSTAMESRYMNYTFGLRKDLFFFYKKYEKDAIDLDAQAPHLKYQFSNDHFNHGWKHYLERVYIKAKWKHLNITLGDFYESMNRGLMLSMKNSPVYGDSTIKGGSLTSKYKGLHSKLFAGYANPILRDQATEKRMEDSEDLLFGGEVGYKFFKKVDLSFQFTGTEYEDYNYQVFSTGEEKTVFTKNFNLFGGNLKLNNIIPKSSIYLGGSYVVDGKNNKLERSRKDDEMSTEKREIKGGNAFYSSLMKWFDIDKSRLSLILEAKRYEKFYVNQELNQSSFLDLPLRRYFSPPTLLWQEMPLYNEFDTWAVRGKVTFKDANFTGLKLSAEIVKGDSNDSHEEGIYDWGEKYKIYFTNAAYFSEDFYFIGGSIEKNFSNFFVFSKFFHYKSTYTRSYDTDPADHSRKWYFAKVQGGGNIGKFSFKKSVDYYHKYDIEEETFNGHSLTNTLDLVWKNRYNVSVIVNYYDEGKKDSSDDPFASKTRPKKTFSPGISTGFKYKNFRTSMFFGKIKGGLTCTGGLCRYVPDFEGVKFELDYKL